ncbi:1554_t:CDS:2 [Dentiscutata heterogama]|uniref:1554_t:CDS:1 n=1 Tax=Dentiscutata heterogama TaxID=1316150 RepID=A0ACA9JW98_9GLOM|nr:1554_t:CDS:2 [Dentiscutata heterogama]
MNLARQAAQKSLEKHQIVSQNKMIAEIQDLLFDLNQEQLADTYKILIELSNNKVVNNKVSRDQIKEQETSHTSKLPK